MHDVDISFDDAFAQFESMIEDARRDWAAKIMRAYPFKAELEVVADALRQDLKASQIEVNSVGRKVQTTVARAPAGATVSIDVHDSLCVIGVGAGVPLQVSDIKRDGFLEGHAAVDMSVCSWASVPIKIAGCSAGTVCALELQEPRVWGDPEQELLEQTATRIGELITEWSSYADLRVL